MTAGALQLPAAEPAANEWDRTPPHDYSAEMSVLGGMMLTADAIADVVGQVKPRDFYRPAHQALYATIVDLFGRGQPADPVTVCAELTRTSRLAAVGGAPYLHTLLAHVPTAANAGYYAEIVADLATRRRLIEAGTRIVQLGYSDGDTASTVDRAQAEIYDVTDTAGSTDPVPISELMPPTFDELERIADHGGQTVGLPTGFADLDDLTQGLHPGQMVVIAARPALGKSTLGLDLARACSIRQGLPAVVFSLEMSRSEISQRLLSAEAKVALHHMRSGRLSDEDWARLARRMGEVADAPLYVDDSGTITMTEIRSKARRLKQQHDLSLIVVDYLQLMTSGKRVENRQQEVSEIARSLKLLAKELDVPVVAISQLNRSPEHRADKIPQLSDLRESGSIEQDADVVILLHREDAHKQQTPRAGEADLILAKHRNGPTGTVTVAFQGHYSRFVDMAGPGPQPAPAAAAPPATWSPSDALGKLPPNQQIGAA